MTDVDRYRYAAEKLYLAVSYAATAAGDARTRLEGTFSQLQVLRQEHVPSEAWGRLAGVLERLTSGEGTVATNAHRMKNVTAAKLLRDIWDAYEIVKRAHDENAAAAFSSNR